MVSPENRASRPLKPFLRWILEILGFESKSSRAGYSAGWICLQFSTIVENCKQILVLEDKSRDESVTRCPEQAESDL